MGRNAMSLIAAVIGRLLLAVMFVVSGLQKIADPAPTAQMLAATNLPATFALPTGVFEVVAGALLAIGLMTRLVAIVLAGFVALTIFFFHNEFADPLQGTLALKNLAIVGGLLMTFAYGQVRGTFDYMRERRRTYDAELRAARAEGRAEAVAAAPHAVPARTVVTDVDGDGVPEVRPRRRWF
jgi:putative oxidoreductase